MTTERDTIFALSSGRPPAAIAVVRISGPRARVALEQLTGRVPQPRRASLARVRDPATGDVIDEGLALWFPGPNSETGEDIAELQVHGGRAVIAAVLAALAKLAETERIALELRYMHDPPLSLAQIAEHLGRKHAKAVAGVLARGLKNIREEMSKPV